MRNFGLQTLVNCVKILRQQEMNLPELLAYGWLWVLPSTKKKVLANKWYDRRDLTSLKSLMFKLARKDPAWFPRLFEPTTLGIRSWEYGVLLSNTNFRNKKILDVGSGNSRLPQNLSRLGAIVTMLDMENPLEDTEKKKNKNLKFVLGDMTRLKFQDNSFDKVICISAIEHVDMKSGGKFYSAQEYQERAIKAIHELARVTKKGGVFYLTTDFYLPQQKTDKWPGSKDKIRGAFSWSYIKLFLDEINKAGIKLGSEPEYGEDLILKDNNRSNYRGRYFSTFAFMGIKIK